MIWTKARRWPPLALGGMLIFTSFAAAQSPGINNQHPSWSPDGQSIAFVSNRTGNEDIFTVRVDGTQIQQWTDTPGIDSYPSWFPSGDRLVFHAAPEGTRDFGLFAINLTTRQRTRLTPNEFFIEASFSSDGKTILLSGRPPGRPGLAIYLMPFDGRSGPELLEESMGLDGFPSWTPGGEGILFHSDRTGVHQIYELELVHRSTRQLTNAPANSMHGNVSPDGRWIVFDSERDGSREIYRMARDGSGVQRLTQNPERDGYPKWSPDGSSIAFHSQRNGTFEIFLMDPDGGNLRQLTDGISSIRQ